MRVVIGADRMRDRMHGAEPFLKGGGAHRGGGQHARACLDVGAVLIGAGQIFLDEAQAFERDAVRKRMKTRRAISLETMGERVEARGRGEEGRQADRGLGVGDDDPRQHERVEDDLLLMRRLVRHD